MLEWSFHGNLCRTIGPLMLHSQEIRAGALKVEREQTIGNETGWNETHFEENFIRKMF